MKHYIAQILNLRHSETKIVSRLMVVQFAMGLGVAFLSTATYSLYLYRFDAEQLPWVYVLTALFLFPINGIYAYADTKFNSRVLFEFVLVIVVLMIALGLIIWIQFQSFFAALLLVTINIIVYMLVGYAYWGMASLLFDVRESRRIFSVIGAGDLPAKMIGYLLVPVIAGFAGLEFAIGVSVILFIIGLLMAYFFLRSAGINWEIFENQQQHNHPYKLSIRGWWNSFFESKLVLWIAVLSFFGYLFYFLVDFTFLTEVKTKSKSVKELTAFISLFFLFGRALALVLKLVLSSRLLSTLGIVKTLLITPLVLLIISVCIGIASVWVQPSFYLYAFGVLALLSEVLRSAIQEPVFFVLFQPLSIHMRLKGHLIAKGYVLPPALFIIGAGLLLYLHFSGASYSFFFVISILMIILIFWIASVSLVKKTYLQLVKDELGTSYFSGAGLVLRDGSIEPILLEKVNEGTDPMEIIHSLDLLERSDFSEITSLLEKSMFHPEPLVALYAIERLTQLKVYEVNNSHISQLMENPETDDKVKDAIIGLGCSQDPHFYKKFYPDLLLAPIHILSAILRSRLTSDSNDASSMEIVKKMAYSEDAELRKLAADMIGQYNLLPFRHLLDILLGDAEIKVCHAALETTGKLKLSNHLPYLIEKVENPADFTPSFNALSGYGENLFEWPGLLVKTLKPSIRNIFIQLAGDCKGEHSGKFLLNEFKIGGNQIHSGLADALWKRTEWPFKIDLFISEQILDTWIQQILQKKLLGEQVSGFTEMALLGKAIQGEVRNDLVSFLKVYGSLYGKEKFERIIQILEMENNSLVPMVLETIELNLPAKYSQKIVSLMEWAITLENAKIAKGGNIDRLTEVLKSMILFSEKLSSWTKGLLYYLLAKNNRSEFKALLPLSVKSSMDEFVQENFDYWNKTFKS